MNRQSLATPQSENRMRKPICSKPTNKPADAKMSGCWTSTRSKVNNKLELYSVENSLSKCKQLQPREVSELVTHLGSHDASMIPSSSRGQFCDVDIESSSTFSSFEEVRTSGTSRDISSAANAKWRPWFPLADSPLLLVSITVGRENCSVVLAAAFFKESIMCDIKAGLSTAFALLNGDRHQSLEGRIDLKEKKLTLRERPGSLPENRFVMSAMQTILERIMYHLPGQQT